MHRARARARAALHHSLHSMHLSVLPHANHAVRVVFPLARGGCVGLHTHVSTCVSPAGGKMEQGLFLSSSVTRSGLKSHGSVREEEKHRAGKETPISYADMIQCRGLCSFSGITVHGSFLFPCDDYYKKIK